MRNERKVKIDNKILNFTKILSKIYVFDENCDIIYAIAMSSAME